MRKLTLYEKSRKLIILQLTSFWAGFDVKSDKLRGKVYVDRALSASSDRLLVNGCQKWDRFFQTVTQIVSGTRQNVSKYVSPRDDFRRKSRVFDWQNTSLYNDVNFVYEVFAARAARLSPAFVARWLICRCIMHCVYGDVCMRENGYVIFDRVEDRLRNPHGLPFA